MDKEELEKRWTNLQRMLTTQFGQEVDVTAALFLVGIQETGQGFRNFDRDEKMQLIHIGGARVLSYFDYFQFTGYDDNGFPHYEKNWEKPAPWDNKRIVLLKEGLLAYFREQNYEV